MKSISVKTKAKIQENELKKPHSIWCNKINVDNFQTLFTIEQQTHKHGATQVICINKMLKQNKTTVGFHTMHQSKQ